MNIIILILLKKKKKKFIYYDINNFIKFHNIIIKKYMNLNIYNYENFEKILKIH